jgi:hypothetical protein
MLRKLTLSCYVIEWVKSRLSNLGSLALISVFFLLGTNFDQKGLEWATVQITCAFYYSSFLLLLAILNCNM